MLVVPLRWKLPWTRCWTLLSFKRMFVYGNCMKFGPKMGGNHQSHPCKTACLRLQVIMKYCTVEDVWINHFGWRLCIGFCFLFHGFVFGCLPTTFTSRPAFFFHMALVEIVNSRLAIASWFHLSSDQNPGWLDIIEDYTIYPITVGV